MAAEGKPWNSYSHGSTTFVIPCLILALAGSAAFAVPKTHIIAYRGVCDDKKLYAMVMQVGRRKARNLRFRTTHKTCCSPFEAMTQKMRVRSSHFIAARGSPLVTS
jgi:hypothetical protein